MTAPAGYTVICHSDAAFRDAVTRELQRLAAPDAPALESEPRCALCRLARVRAAGLTCRACGADLDAMHRGRQW